MTHYVMARIGSLAVGTYNGTLTITDPNPKVNVMKVTVTLNITATGN